MASVSFESKILQTLNINNSDDFVENVPYDEQADHIFRVYADLNYVFGPLWEIKSSVDESLSINVGAIKMPHNITTPAPNTNQGSVDFTDEDIEALRARILPLLTNQANLSGDAGTYKKQMATQLANLFDNMELEDSAKIGDDNVRIKDSMVFSFLNENIDNSTVAETKDQKHNMVTRTFSGEQLGQLLESAARDASRYKQDKVHLLSSHTLDLREGDRISCLVKVNAKSSSHVVDGTTGEYVNSQIWRIEFEQKPLSGDQIPHYQIMYQKYVSEALDDVTSKNETAQKLRHSNLEQLLSDATEAHGVSSAAQNTANEVKANASSAKEIASSAKDHAETAVTAAETALALATTANPFVQQGVTDAEKALADAKETLATAESTLATAEATLATAEATSAAKDAAFAASFAAEERAQGEYKEADDLISEFYPSGP